MANSNIVSANNPASIVVRPGGKYYASDVIIDMTGWNNGEHGDVSYADEGIYSYAVCFEDGAGKGQRFSTDNVKSGGLYDIFRKLRTEYNVKVVPSTQVTVICPHDCLKGYSKPNAVSYACSSSATVEKLDAKGMRALDFGVLPGSVAEGRLESCLDEVVHQYAIGVDYGAAFREARFKHSIYDYYDEDNKRATDRQMRLDADVAYGNM